MHRNNNYFIPQREELVGEDAAYFDVEQQSTGKWVFFTVELAVVLGIMYVVGPSSQLKALSMLREWSDGR